jgi:putative transposase
MNGSRIYLSSIGKVKLRVHRDMIAGAKIKTCTVKKNGKHWYCSLTFETSKMSVPKKIVSSAIGIDLGLENFATLSNGETIDNPRHLRKSEDRLKEIQSEYSIRKTKTTKQKLIKLHRKIANQRTDFLHKESTKLINSFDMVAYEDLNIKGMVNGRFSKGIHDAGWGKFIAMIEYKAESAGTYAISVNPYHTSQICSGCGTLVKKEIHQRFHNCPICSLSIHRDLNAAINILKSGTDSLLKMLRQLAAG